MPQKSYDYLIVGAGPYGAVCAHELTKAGKKCLVIDKRPHAGGNLWCKEEDGINVHYYGAHIFHTSNKKIWDYVNSFVPFNRYTNSPLAFYKGRLYNLPFNMNTFYQLWGVTTPAEAAAKIEDQKKSLNISEEPQNLEEQALKLVGPDVYYTLIKGYTEKQWGRAATEIPAFIIRRLPVRFTFDNNYFNDLYQGIPIGGYNKLIDALLAGIEVRTGVDFFEDRAELEALADHIIYTGKIDQFFDYRFGDLAYRSLRFDHRRLDDVPNFQGNAVVNYTEREVPYTRIIEHKHFEFGQQPHTVITYEFSQDGGRHVDPYYPINDAENMERFAQYKALAAQYPHITFGGRLGEYKYYDMHQVIEVALNKAAELLKDA